MSDTIELIPQIFNYYSTPGIMTEVSEYKRDIAEMPDSMDALVLIVQGLLVHGHWLKSYGIEDMNERRTAEMNIRPMSERIKLIKDHDPKPLSSPREILQRQIGCCRDFTLMLVSFLRCKGIPARARCGFGRYFLSDHYEDHWVAEYYDVLRQRWIMVDPQIDALQRGKLNITFDTLDMPRDQFVTGGEAWFLVRERGFDPDLFGIFKMRGMDFIKGDFVRDISALGKIELLPWDIWGIMEKKYSEMSDSEISELDEIARMTMSPDDHFDSLQRYAESDSRFQPGVAFGTFWNGKYSRLNINRNSS
jgi:hypothetical protein